MIDDLIYNAKLLGENLKRLRIIQDLTLEEASAKSGLSKSFISLIESGNRNIKTQDLRILLNTYGYTSGKFLSDAQGKTSESETSKNKIVQHRNKTILLEGERDEGKFSLVLLRPIRKEDDIEIIELNLPPKTEMTKDMIVIPAEIRGFVISGTLLIEFQSDEFTVAVGEEFTYDGNKPHTLRNFTKEPAKVLLIIHPPVL